MYRVKVSSPIFAEALLIHLARQGNIRAEELIKYQIPVEIAKEFADYTGFMRQRTRV